MHCLHMPIASYIMSAIEKGKMLMNAQLEEKQVYVIKYGCLMYIKPKQKTTF